jgi:two-component system, sensor histidine kinase PdtaS
MMPSHTKQTAESALPRIQQKRNVSATTIKTRVPLPVSEDRERLAGDDLLDCVPGLVWKTDENGFYTYFNRAWLKFRGRSFEEERGMGWIDSIHPDDLKNALNIHAEASINRQPFVRRFRVLGADQQYHWVKDHGSPVLENDVFRGYCGTGLDFTEEYNKEQALQESLQQNEILLKETNHRFKNNLQILFSLLSLEAQRATDENVKSILQDCKNRVQVIVLLHQKLSESKDELNFAGYVRDLAQMVSNSYGNSRSNIDLQMDVQPLSLHADKIIPCALIVTELLSNSFKHAFPDNNGGKIHVRVYPESTDCILEISDGGIGLIGNHASAQPRSLGLKLVSMFVKQLDGDLKIDGSSGTKVTIRFPR